MPDTTTDYNAVVVDESKRPAEYHYTERRAEILERMFEVGSPRLLDTKALSDRYGVVRKTIYNDIEALAEFVAENIGQRSRARTQLMFERVIDEMLAEGKHRQAWKTVMEWNEWLENRGFETRQPERVDARVDAHVSTGEFDPHATDSYEIVPADEVEQDTAEASLSALPEGSAESEGEASSGDEADE